MTKCLLKLAQFGKFAANISRFSTSIINAPRESVYARIRNFVVENPIFRDPNEIDLSTEPSTKLSLMQVELLQQIEEQEGDQISTKIRPARLTTRDFPNLIAGKEERRIAACICHEEFNHVNHLLLFRGIPTRCQCGHWFKLVTMDEYEAARDRYWNKIKDEPANAKLMQDLNDAEAELRRLVEASKNMNKKSPGANEMLDNLSIQWKKFKYNYSKIREVISAANVTDIR